MNINKSMKYVLTLLRQINLMAIFLNVEPSNLVFLKTYNTVFDEIIIRFTDENGRTVETENEVTLTLLINKQKCHGFLQNQKQEKMLKDMDFYHSQENKKGNYQIKD